MGREVDVPDTKAASGNRAMLVTTASTNNSILDCYTSKSEKFSVMNIIHSSQNRLLSMVP